MSIRWPSAWTVFALAFALRFGVAVGLPNVHHPDEIFQAFEQAHRVVFGYGLVPWEYRTGARSWLMPGLLMGPMWVGKWLAPGTELFRIVAQALLSALSATTAVVAWSWGRRSGPLHALLAALVVATWFEFVYFGAKAFSEVVAGTVLFAAAYLCTRDIARGEHPRPVLAGFCLGAALAFRFHLAPAVLLVAAAGWRSLRAGERTRFLLAAALPVLVLGAVDGLTWGLPFASVANNFTANITDGVSLRYGTHRPDWYLLELLENWGAAALLILGLAAWRSRRQPLPMGVALAIVLSHSVIAHKEYRFIEPALLMLVFLAAEGSADLCRLLGGRIGAAWTETRWGFVAACIWILLSLSRAVSDPMWDAWHRARGGLQLLSAAREADACGVAISGTWAWTGGYASLHRNVPLHLLWDGNRAAWDSRAFNAWVGPAGWNEPRDAGFALQRCEPESIAGRKASCLWVRKGRCESHPETLAQPLIEERGD